MIVISLNIRGVGGAPKSLSLKRLFDLVKPYLVMIQETMVDGFNEREVFSKKFPAWDFYAVDSKGFFGGLLSAWNTKKSNFNAFLTPAGILLEGFVKKINKNLKLINCYGPYADRQSFWNTIKNDGILKESNLILGNDLNFTISARETWGNNARSDPLDSYFNQMIQGEGLIDIEPINLLPTWRNGRGTQDYVAKRLDHFLISESLVDSGNIFRTWVVNVKISDHMPVVFQMEPTQQKHKVPFKFNLVWLKDPYFASLV
jgi:hypothetical protein